MSRSFKKHGFVKDKGYSRAFYNRKFRRINKYRIRIGKEPLLLDEVVNYWCICDYAFLWSPPQEHPTPPKDKAALRAYNKDKRLYFGK